jgi:hypothetical protein
MYDKEDKEMPQTQNRDKAKSPNQGGLDAIASSFQFDKLPRKKTLSIKPNGVVDIDSSHPDYKYWLEDDE